MLSIRRCVELFLVFSSIGCVTIQDCEYRAAQNCRAHKAWWCGCDERCSSNPFSDYAKGWRRGYADVLLGGDGECPPVPPQCYWSYKYQSECGEAAIEEWYQGYSHGGAVALASCRGDYHPVPISNTFRDCGDQCLPSDFAPYDFGRTTLSVTPASRAVGDEPDIVDSPTVPEAPTAPNDYEPGPDEAPSPASPGAIENPVIPPPPAATSSTESTNKRNQHSSGKWLKSASISTKWSTSIFQATNRKTDQN